MTAPSTLRPEDLPGPLGERATLVQFSSTFCAPCRATRLVLDRVISTTTGVTISCLKPSGPVRQAGFDVEEGAEVIIDETGTRPPFDQ